MDALESNWIDGPNWDREREDHDDDPYYDEPSPVVWTAPNPDEIPF